MSDSVNKNGNSANSKANDQGNLGLTISVITLFLLIILSAIIIFTRLAVSLPFSDDSFIIDSKLDSVEFGDDEKIWDLNTEVTIFKYSDVDEYGNVVVESIDGNKIIAPGMEGDYCFEIRNLNNFAVDTEVIVTAKLTVNGEVFENVPIEIRLTDYTGELINGGWNKVGDVNRYDNELTIGKKCYIYYTLDWRWAFEGNDELDTLLGDLSAFNDVVFSVNIVGSASKSNDKNASGGLPINDSILGPSLFDIRPLILINVILFLIIVTVLAYKEYKRKKEAKKKRIVSKK